MMLSKSFTYKEFRDTVVKHLELYSSNGRENTDGEISDIEKRLPEILSAQLRAFYDEYGVGRRLESLPVGKYSLVFYGEDLEVDGEESMPLPKAFPKFAYRLVASGTGTVQLTDCKDASVHQINTRRGEYIQLSGVAEPNGESPAMLLAALDTLHVKSLEITAVPSFVTDFVPVDTDTFKSLARLPDNTSRIVAILDECGNRLSEAVFRVYGEDGVIAIPTSVDRPLFIDCLTSPATVTEKNADNCEITLPPLLFDALCYACAAVVCPSSEPALAERLTYKYREMLENIYDRYKDRDATRNRFYGRIGRRRFPFGK